MQILITGAEGFIGSHLTELLLKQGFKVRAMVFYNFMNNHGWQEEIQRNIAQSKIKTKNIYAKYKKNYQVVVGDVRDYNCVLKAMEGVDWVFHLAALIAIPYSYLAPSSYIETNINGTHNILQAARTLKTRRVFITSTSEVYGTALYAPIDEKHPLQGQSPYSASKIGADKMAESFYRSFGLPITIIRPFNTFGPRQSARAFIPTIITQLLNGVNKIRVGDLTPKRDMVFVKDTVNGFLKIAESSKTIGEEINIATQKEISMGDLAMKIAKIIKKQAGDNKGYNNESDPIIFEQEKIRVRPKNSEVMRLLGSNKKIKALSGWSPQYNVDEGLEETIAWFSEVENLKLYKHSLYNV